MLLAVVRRCPYLACARSTIMAILWPHHGNTIFIGEGLRKAYEFEINQNFDGVFNFRFML